MRLRVPERVPDLGLGGLGGSIPCLKWSLQVEFEVGKSLPKANRVGWWSKTVASARADQE